MKKILLNGVDGNFGGKSAGILLEKYPHEDLIFTAPREKALKKYKEMGIEQGWLIIIMQKLLWKHLKEQILLY